MKKVVAPFLTNNMYRIVPEHILGSVPIAQIKSHPFSTGDPKQTVGTGPFKYQDWVKDDHATLARNPDYFRGAPALDQYVFKVVKDSNVVAAQIKTGEADYAGVSAGITAVFYDDMSKQPNLNVYRYDQYQGTFVSFQLDTAKSTLFQQKEVRQALMYALDRASMIKAIENGFGTIAQGTLPPPSWAYAPDQIKPQYTYDLTKANQMLDEAGWAKGSDGIRAKDGKKLSFNLWTFAGNKVREQQVTAMQQMWKGVGVDATIKTEEWNAFLSRLTESHDFDVILVAYGVGTDPDQTTFFACDAYKSGFNVGKYCNPQVDALLTKGLSELDQAKRKQIYLDMENILWDDLPTILTDFAQGIDVVNKRVHNMRPNATNFRWNAETWWVADGK